MTSVQLNIASKCVSNKAFQGKFGNDLFGNYILDFVV